MTTPTRRSKFSEFKARRLNDPAIRAAYEDARCRNIIIDALVRRRRALGLKQIELANAMDVGQSTVSGFETEGSDPRLSTLQRYARAVNSSLYVQVVPNMPDGRRMNTYLRVEQPKAPVAAAHSAPSERARSWAADNASPYERRLKSVPDPIPA